MMMGRYFNPASTMGSVMLLQKRGGANLGEGLLFAISLSIIIFGLPFLLYKLNKWQAGIKFFNNLSDRMEAFQEKQKREGR